MSSPILENYSILALKWSWHKLEKQTVFKASLESIIKFIGNFSFLFPYIHLQTLDLKSDNLLINSINNENLVVVMNRNLFKNISNWSHLNSRISSLCCPRWKPIAHVFAAIEAHPKTVTFQLHVYLFASERYKRCGASETNGWCWFKSIWPSQIVHCVLYERL